MKIMSIYSNKNEKKPSKSAVLTKDGSKLIGVIVTQENVINNVGFVPSITYNQKGIYLKRKKCVSFLGEDAIKLIRPARPGEKEIEK
ncbi:hypothetical protein FQ087_22145 [Sporosarcina sp. ANT_H38]|uniref:hypothetical protein n=2 Tax=unclassified Sporosarcina TaxID=2647733 RepID=UPI0011F2CDB9|nr:hypothetical protein [Sporosarcina sp. ANT_H38]KAA0940018.1 hypothetical protein FQ087_22145 [Sporosarcina sp. ANT_H38]